MAGLLQEIVSPSSAKRLGHVFMMLLDGATVEARATNDSHPAAIAWDTAEKLLEQEIGKTGVVARPKVRGQALPRKKAKSKKA